MRTLTLQIRSPENREGSSGFWRMFGPTCLFSHHSFWSALSCNIDLTNFRQNLPYRLVRHPRVQPNKWPFFLVPRPCWNNENRHTLRAEDTSFLLMFDIRPKSASFTRDCTVWSRHDPRLVLGFTQFFHVAKFILKSPPIPHNRVAGTLERRALNFQRTKFFRQRLRTSLLCG